MKKLYLFCILTICAATKNFAQDSTSTNPGTQQTHKSSSTQEKNKFQELGLTSEQQEKINTISAEEKTKREAIESNKDLTDDQKKEQLKALKKETKTKKNSVLTPDQKAKLKTQKNQDKTSSSQNATPSNTPPNN